MSYRAGNPPLGGDLSSVVWWAHGELTRVGNAFALNERSSVVGSILSSAGAAPLGVGYAVGAGASVSQATSKATNPPAINKATGQIVMHAGSAINANSAVSFTVSNTAVVDTDTPIVVITSGATAGAYTVTVDAVAAGSFQVSIRNMTAGNLSEALILQFNIIKGAAT